MNEADIPKVAKVLGGRLILSLNICVTLDGKSHLIYIELSFDEYYKPYMVHDTITVRKSSIRILYPLVLYWDTDCPHITSFRLTYTESPIGRSVDIQPKNNYRVLLVQREGEIL